MHHLSPYTLSTGKHTIPTDPSRIPNNQWDASCNRSYASMANHAPEDRANARLKVFVNLQQRNWVPDASKPDRLRPSVSKGRHTHTAPLLMHEAPISFDLNSPRMIGPAVGWLVAIRRIAKGQQILTYYGTEAQGINELHHETTPAFCTLSDTNKPGKTPA